MNNDNAPLLIIIDDEIHVRESLSQFLREIGHYRTITFAEGNEALDWLKTHKCALCIVDIKMPGLNGIETILEIRKMHPQQKFIIFTGSRFQNIPDISEKVGIPEEFFVVKPLSTMEIFLDKISKLLNQ
ncbi:MAG: response regulator [Candidatus Aureabacteria bacterium]|nr:response regulator [Candidatus Auribacterota bacterium]